MVERRLATLQALRAIACLMVVAFHAAPAWANGAAGVDLFFVVSGLVMAVSPHHGAARFLGRRLWRIVPLYWGLTAAKLAVTLAIPSLTPHTHPAPWNLLASFLFLPARDGAGLVRPVLPVGWTLEFEMLFYAGFALCLASGLRPWRVLPWALLPLAVGGFWRAPDWPAPAIFCNGLVLEFCLGMGLGRALLAGRLPGGVAAACVALAGLVLLFTLPSMGPWRGLAWGVPAAMLVGGAVALERVLAPRLPRAAQAVGDASYAIYLTHPFAAPLDALPLGRVVAAASGVAAGLAVHRWIERPVARWRSRSTAGGPAQAGRSVSTVADFIRCHIAAPQPPK